MISMVSFLRVMMRKIIVGLIHMYQFLISPLLGPSCRYYPTCSEYAVEAVQRHGLVKGSFLAVTRVLRCHPGYEGGLDPVPEKAAVNKKCLHIFLIKRPKKSSKKN